MSQTVKIEDFPLVVPIFIVNSLTLSLYTRLTNDHKSKHVLSSSILNMKAEDRYTGL